MPGEAVWQKRKIWKEMQKFWFEKALPEARVSKSEVILGVEHKEP